MRKLFLEYLAFLSPSSRPGKPEPGAAAEKGVSELAERTERTERGWAAAPTNTAMNERGWGPATHEYRGVLHPQTLIEFAIPAA